jgi:hypothetical protein
MKKLCVFSVIIILILSSCHKDGPTLRNDDNVSQAFILYFDKETNLTTVSANFEIDGQRFALDGNESIKCNNQSYSSLSGNSDRTYKWVFSGKQDVQFVLTKNSGEVLTNNVAFNNYDVTIANTFDSIYRTQDLTVHFSPALQDTEGITIYLSQPNHPISPNTPPPQYEGIGIDSAILHYNRFSYFSTGDATMKMSRGGSYRRLQQTDAAGGVAYVDVSDTKHFYFR